jgi:integrase
MPMPQKRRRYGTGSLFLNGRTWWLRYYSNGQRVTENSQLEDRSAAEDLLKQRVAEAAAGQIEISAGRATIADLCELVLADHRLRKLRDAKTVEWRCLAHVKSTLGKIQASRATAKHIGSYIEDRRSARASDSTINRELSIVRRAYTLGMREDPPIVRKAPYIPKLEEDNVRQGFLEPEQYEQLLAELPANLKALFVCAYHTGARKNELRRALWEQVDFESGMIRLTVGQTKSKKARTLPIYGDMERWLRMQQESAKGSRWVFHGAQKKPVSSKLYGWTEACERAGLPELKFHDLRRSAVRNMKRAGVQDKVAMEISGHRTRSIFDRYNIVDEGDLGNAAQKLEQYSKQRKAERAAKLKRVK